MKYFPLIWAALWRKPLRTIFTTLALAAAFTLFGVLEGVNHGADALVASTKLDRMYTDALFFGPMPYAHMEQIAKVPGVRLVAPNSPLGGYYQDPKQFFGMVTSDERFLAVRDEIIVPPDIKKRWLETRNGILIGPLTAKNLNLKPGDHPVLHSLGATKKDGSKDFEFEVIGIVEDETAPGLSGFTVAHYDYVNELRAQGKDTVARILVRVDDADHIAEVAKQIDQMFINSPFPTRTQTDRSMGLAAVKNVGDVKLFVNAIVGASLFMLLFVTTTTTLQSFRERIPEFAVLKTLGFSNAAVVGLLIGETVAQSIAGAAIGLALARAAAPVIRANINIVPSVMQVPVIIMAAGMLLSLVVGVASGLIPAWQAQKLDVVDGLRAR